MAKTYKGATHDKLGKGNFKNNGQKLGGKKPLGKESKGKAEQAHAALRKISKAMFGRRKTLNNDINQRAQLNA